MITGRIGQRIIRSFLVLWYDPFLPIEKGEQAYDSHS